MTPEIENYLLQSRAAGKSDEVIKQELLTSGWDEATANQVLGMGQTASLPVEAAPIATAPAKATLSGKLIAAVILGLLIIIVGIYFAFFRPGPQSLYDYSKSQLNQTTQNYAASKNLVSNSSAQQSTSTLDQNNNAPSSTPNTQTTNYPKGFNFNCTDLITDNDLQNITGLGTLKLNINGVSGQTQDPGGLHCSFGSLMNDLVYLTIAPINLLQSVSTAEKDYIPNVGSTAVYDGSNSDTSGMIRVFSSNKKYSFYFTYSSANKTSDQTKAESIKIAQFIDANLNKY